MRHGAGAWTALVVGIAAYEKFAPEEELMSEAADRWIMRQPVLARVVILLVGLIITAHVSNLIPQPEMYDVMSHHFWNRILN